MKLTINYYILKQLRENFVYALALIMTISIFAYVLSGWIKEYYAVNQKIKSSESEIETLQKRKNILSSLIASNLTEIREFNIILNKLIPSVEDYFTIIYALEKLSQDSNFLISNYGINLQEATVGRFSITLSGDGDIDSFYKFLDLYNYSSGRLITMNDFDFNNQGIQYTLTLNFYSQPVPQALIQLGSIPKKDIAFMRNVRKKVEFILKAPESPKEEKAGRFDYPTTSDLFQ